MACAQIVLLGVCLAPGPGGDDGVPSSEEVTLQPLPLYAVPSDNVTMCAVAAGPNGRIFLGGADGHLYEVVYAPGDTWRARRCYKVLILCVSVVHMSPRDCVCCGGAPGVRGAATRCSFSVFLFFTCPQETVYAAGTPGAPGAATRSVIPHVMNTRSVLRKKIQANW